MPTESEARVKEVIQRTYNVKSVRLNLNSEIDFQAGQFLCVILKTNPELKRYLSISNSPTEKGYLEFTKKLTQSDFSGVLDNLKPGDIVKLQYPFGKFTLRDDYKKIAFLSGGIGITPIRSISKFVVDKRLGMDIALIYANRTINDIVFRDDFEAMRKVYPKLKVVHVLSEATPGFNSLAGRIDSSIVKQEIPDYAERKFYLCGPPAMVEAMQKILTDELAMPKEGIVTENFQGY